jgi:uncharacterized repeat protein (TIGR01451 family)
MACLVLEHRAKMPLIPLARIFARLLVLACLLVTGLAHADLITRTITINGNFTDWDGSGGSYTPAGNILTNTNQFNTDCLTATPCERDGSLSSTGRDLKKFAFTWDNSNLYFYTERWTNASNATDWWFYMDTSGNGKMDSGEKVVHVKWTGSNGTTVVTVGSYVQSASGGDPVVGSTGFADGYTMPGSVINEVNPYGSNTNSVTGGATTGTLAGLAMETYIPWSVLGASGPTNMFFHISSSNGSNLPSSIVDNMDGSNSDQLFPSDLEVLKTASVSTIGANMPFTYTVEVRNLGYNSFTGVAVSDVLPADVVYQSYSATAGSYVDTNSNGIPDRWNVGAVGPQSSAFLTITVKGANVTAPVIDTNTASLVAWTGTNFYAGDDSASVSVTINPGPLLNVTKTSSTATATPGQIIRYTVHVSNIGYSVATAVVAVDKFSPFTAFRLNTFGVGQNVQFSQGTPTSGVLLGTVTYSSDNGSTYAYTPASGGGGAPAGYDANVTNMRVPMTGSMVGVGGNFSLLYDVIVR